MGYRYTEAVAGERLGSRPKDCPPRVCAAEGCTRPLKGRGWCSLHYKRWLAMQPKASRKAPLPCEINGCKKPQKARGWCGMHYWRWQTHGDVLWVPPAELERFLSMVDKNGPIPECQPDLGPCWLWTGNLRSGYGRIRLNWQVHLAHRWSYEFFVGPIGAGLTIDHLCRTPACVNPAHLEPVTMKENILRGTSRSAQNAAKTECLNGHPFDQENTYVSRKGRACRACRNIRRAPRQAS